MKLLKEKDYELNIDNFIASIILPLKELFYFILADPPMRRHYYI